MIYANDQWIQMPVVDLYNSLAMYTAINAAKDMYEKGLLEYKDFRKDYGDFMSPFSKDMARYGEMMKGVQNTINDLYANGIDPLRSAEGRAAVSRAIQSIDPSEYNNMRANAKVGYAYLDALGKLNAAGKFNKDMNDFYLELYMHMPRFEDFSSANGATWGLSSPIEATTLQELTDSGYQHRTPHDISKEDAKRILGSAFDPRAKYTGWIDKDSLDVARGLIPGLEGDWRSIYYRNQAAQQLGLDPKSSDPNVQAAIDEQYARNIADSNRRWLIDPKGDLDDFYKEEANRISMLKSRDGGDDPYQNYQWSFAELVKRSGQTSILGKQPQQYMSGMLGDVINEQLRFGKLYYKNPTSGAVMNAYKSKYGQNTYNISDIAVYMESLGFLKVPGTTASFVIPKDKIDKLEKFDALVSNTAGRIGPHMKTVRKRLKDADVIVYTPSGGSYLAFMKNDRNESYFDGLVTTYTYMRDDAGNILKDDKGHKIYDETKTRTSNYYFDPDIKTIKNAPGTGSLIGPKNRIATDTRDYRFQNSVSADKVTTDNIVKGTIYDTDAILTELPLYAK